MNDSLPNRRIELEDFADSLGHLEVVLLAIVMTSICLATIIGNTLVLVSFLLNKKLRSLNNYFILSLAVSDTMIATFAMPFFTLYVLNGEWLYGPVICEMWLAQDYMCSSASSLNLLMIAFDRYFSVTNPLWYRARKNGKLVAGMISCVWVLSFFIFPPWIYLWQYIEGRRTVPDDDCYVQFLETNSYLTVITAAVAYYIPLSIICFLYFRIWRETVKRKRFLARMEAENNSTASILQYKTPKKMSKTTNSPKIVLSCESSQQQKDKKIELATMIPSHVYTSRQIDTPKLTPNNAKYYNSAIEMSDNPPEFHSDRVVDETSLPKLSSSSSKSVKQDSKAARMLATILFAFIVTTTPYNVAVVIKNFDTSRTLVPNAAWFFFYYLYYINSALNPICYALANVQFRNTYWNILKCSWKQILNNNTSCHISSEKKVLSRTSKSSLL